MRPPARLTTEQIEALGFAQATRSWRDGLATPLVAMIAGVIGAALVLAVGRTKNREANVEEQPRVLAGV